MLAAGNASESSRKHRMTGRVRRRNWRQRGRLLAPRAPRWSTTSMRCSATIRGGARARAAGRQRSIRAGPWFSAPRPS